MRNRFDFARSNVIVFSSVAIFFLLAWISARYFLDQERRKSTEDLAGRIATIMEQDKVRLRESLLQAENHVRFFAATPICIGMGRALTNGGIDPIDGSSLAQWRIRLERLAAAYLTAQPHVFRLRLIGVADGGREIVKVIREKSGNVNIIAGEALLSRIDRLRFEQALRLPEGGVDVSSIDNGQDQGGIDGFPRPSLIAAMPLHEPKGHTYGVIMVDMMAKPLLDAIGNSELPQVRTWVTDASGHVLRQPKPGLVNDQELAPSSVTWQRRFAFVAGIELPEGRFPGLEQAIMRAPEGKEWLMFTQVLRDPDSDGKGGVLLHSGIALDDLSARAWESLRGYLLLLWAEGLFAIGLVTFLLLKWHDRSSKPVIDLVEPGAPGGTQRLSDLKSPNDTDRSIPRWQTGASILLPVVWWAILRFWIGEGFIHFPFVIMVPPVLLASWLGGLPAGIAATILATLGALDLASAATPSLVVPSKIEPSDVLAILTSILVGLMISFTHESVRRIGAKILAAEHAKLQEREAADAQIRKSREQLQFVADHAPVLIAQCDRSLRYRFVNEPYAALFGRRPEEVVGLHPRELLGATAFREAAAHMERALAGQPVEFELNLPETPSGPRLMWVKYQPEEDAPGHVIGFVASVIDVTQRRQAELALRQFKSTLDATQDCVFMFRPDTLQFFYVNQGACRHFGYSETELLAMHPYDFDPEYAEPEFRALISPLLTGNQDSLRFESSHRHRDGHVVPVEVFMQYVVPAGETPRFVQIVTDITDRTRLRQELIEERNQLEQTVRRRTNELEKARDVAESATRAKTDFLANMSHEVRSPISVIIGYADLLLDPMTPLAERNSAFQAIRRNSKHLLQVVNDVLDLSRIEAGKTQVDLTRCNPWEILQAVVETYRAQAADKQIGLELLKNDDVPESLLADQTRLRQILINLLNNALKFTESGKKVTVSLTVSPDDRSASFSIMDQGIGISAEQISHLFKPFEQADSSKTRRYGGTGLGLSISKLLAEAMGGRIEVESTPNLGSTFRLIMPLDQDTVLIPIPNDHSVPETHETTSKVEDSGDTGRVLLVEDSPDLQGLMKYHLRKAGLNVEVASNGVECLEKCRERPFDVIIMDVQMPEMDGLTATKKLRERADRTPIIGLSAHAMVGEKDRNLAGGMNEYLTKPVDLGELLELTRHYVDRSNPKPAADSMTQ